MKLVLTTLILRIIVTGAQELCSDDSQCAADRECVGGACGDTCTETSDCGSSSTFACLFSQCVIQCTAKSACASHQLCMNGFCAVPCTDIDGCSCPGLRNSICYDQMCYYRCHVPTDCPPGLGCSHGVCVSVLTCASDSDCEPTGLHCVGGHCALACSEDTDCPSSHMCSQDGMCAEKVAHRCAGATGATGAVIDNYCGCGSHCEDTGLCGLTETIGRSCNGTVSCGLYQACNDVSKYCSCIRDHGGHCMQPPPLCDWTYDTCSYYATGSVCHENDRICTCPGGSLVSGSCYAETSTCHSRGEACPSSAPCRSGICYPRCQGVNDCPMGLTCYEGVCTISCWRDDECGYSQLCVNGRCVQMCAADGSCDTGTMSCDSYRCRVDCASDSACEDDSQCIPAIGCMNNCADDAHCVAGYEVCVSGLCTPICKTDSDCSATATCLNNRCFVLCGDDQACAGSQVCNVGLCMLSCEDSSECNTREVCAYDKCRITCNSDADCLTDIQICFAGLCSYPCDLSGDGDRACEPGDDCIERYGKQGCIPTCATTCNEAQYCMDALCWEIYKSECSDDRQCEPYHYCGKKVGEEKGQCQAKVRVGTSCPENNCGTNEVCVDGVCQCAKFNHGDCLGPYPACPTSESRMTCELTLSGSSCNADRRTCECPANKAQIGRRCVTSSLCRVDGDCPDGSCVSYHCYPLCSPSDVCTPPMVCVSGMCALNCTGDGHCDYNQACVGGECVTKCDSEDGNECASNQRCDIRSKTCRKVCYSDSQCADVQGESGICVDGLCARLCENNGDCGVGEVCDATTGICVQSCLTDKYCSQGDHCIAGICTARCEKQPDCPTNYGCQLGLCYPQCQDRIGCVKRPGSVCFKGNCVTLCNDDSIICGGARCAAGMCSALCQTDIQCGSGKCDVEKGGCYFECTTDEDCGPGQTCSSTSSQCESVYGLPCGNDESVCGSDYYCDSDTQTCMPIYRPGMLCKTSSQCGPGEVCGVGSRCECAILRSGLCAEVTSCTTDSDCPATMGSAGTTVVCDADTGFCMCADSYRLMPNGRCGKEFQACTSQTCPTSEMCYDLRCTVNGCLGGTNCGATEQCTNDYCLPACTTDQDCPSMSMSCVKGSCVSLCSTTLMSTSPCVEGVVSTPCGTCSTGWECKKEYCVITCAEQGDCARNQICVDGICRCDHDNYICSGPNAASDGSGGGPKSCTTRTDCSGLEYCQFGRCVCQDGAIRHSSDGNCVWDLDRVCHSCAACIGSCPGANQICNTYSRLCICAAGYKLDRTGVSCTQISGAATDVGCRTQHDCAGYPNTVCSRALGRCVCRTGLCYTDGDCALDTNECADMPAEGCGDGEETCTNTPCRETPQCVDPLYETGLTTFGLADSSATCVTSPDCRIYKSRSCYNMKCGLVYCYNNKCTCEAGTLIFEDEEGQKTCRVVRCTQNSECEEEYMCSDSGTCVLIVAILGPVDASARKEEDDGMSMGILAAILAGALLALLLLLLLLFLLVRKCTKSKAEKQRLMWEEEEARLEAEEAELDKLEKEYEEEKARRLAAFALAAKEKKAKQDKERREREEAERLKREQEEQELADEAEREKAERERMEKEEKAAKAKEKKMKADARKKAEAERMAKMEAQRAALEAEAEERKKKIEADRIQRENEEKARLKAEKDAEEQAKRQQEEQERKALAAQKAKREEMKRKQEEERLKRQKNQKDKLDKLKQRELEEQKRLAALKKSRAQDSSEEEEEDLDMNVSGWTTAPNLTGAMMDPKASTTVAKEQIKAKNRFLAS